MTREQVDALKIYQKILDELERDATSVAEGVTPIAPHLGAEVRAACAKLAEARYEITKELEQ